MTKPKSITLSCLLFLLLFLLPLVHADQAEASSTIALVYRSDLPLHRELALQVTNSLKLRIKDGQIFSLPLSPEWTTDNEKAFKNQDLSFVVAFGDTALSFCRNNRPDLPGFFLLVGRNDLVDQSMQSGLWNGTKLWVDHDDQLEKLKILLPGINRIGSVVSPGYFSKRQKKNLKRQAKNLGFQLEIFHVSERPDILPAIEKVYKNNDAFWMMPDPKLVNEITLSKMLRLQTDLNRPLITISPRFVQLGALLSINYSLSNLVDLAVLHTKNKLNEGNVHQTVCLSGDCYTTKVS